VAFWEPGQGLGKTRGSPLISPIEELIRWLRRVNMFFGKSGPRYF